MPIALAFEGIDALRRAAAMAALRERLTVRAFMVLLVVWAGLLFPMFTTIGRLLGACVDRAHWCL